MNKLFLFTSLFLFSSIANACICPGTDETSQEIYDRVDGIYIVAIVAINKTKKSDKKYSTELVLKLEIIDSIKGKTSGVLKAKAYGHIPKKNINGEIINVTGSCDMGLSFGESYMLAIEYGEIINISRCNPQIINSSQWYELKKIKKELQSQ